jgi:hypothetical protein
MMNEHMADRQTGDDGRREELAELLGAADEQEAKAFLDAIAEVDLQLEPVTPDPASKAAVFARIDALAADATAETDPPVASPALSATAHVAPARPRGARRRMPRPALLVGAIAAALVLFLGGVAVGGLRNAASPHQSAQADPIATILAQPDSLRASHSVSGGGTATLVWSAQQGSAAIVLSGTGRAPSGKTYQLWYLRSGRAISAGTLDGSPSDAATQRLSGRIQAGDQVAITVERSGGVAQPTGTPIVVIPTST